MAKPFRSPKSVRQLLKSREFSTKIKIFFSTKFAGDDFDPFEQNFVHTTLNPKTLRGYFRELSPESLVFKEYGLHRMGAAELIVEERFRGWFENSERIVIEGNDYQVFRHGTGNKSIMHKRAGKLLRVIIARKD